MTLNTSVLHCVTELENNVTCPIFTKFTVFSISGEFSVPTVAPSHPANKFENCFFLQNLKFILKANILSALFQLDIRVFQCCLWFQGERNLLSVFLQPRPKLIH